MIPCSKRDSPFDGVEVKPVFTGSKATCIDGPCEQVKLFCLHVQLVTLRFKHQLSSTKWVVLLNMYVESSVLDETLFICDVLAQGQSP